MHVAADVGRGLLEGDEDAGLIGLGDVLGQELGSKDRLGAAGGAGHQGGAALGQPTVGDQVEALDIGFQFLDLSVCREYHEIAQFLLHSIYYIHTPRKGEKDRRSGRLVSSFQFQG